MYLGRKVCCFESWQRLCKSGTSYLLPGQHTGENNIDNLVALQQLCSRCVGTCCPVNLEVNPAKAINKGLSICALVQQVAVFGNTCKTCRTRRYVCQIACVDHSFCTSLTADSWSSPAVSSNTTNALHSAASMLNFMHRSYIRQFGQQICLHRGLARA